jgi:hypothetical protein
MRFISLLSAALAAAAIVGSTALGGVQRQSASAGLPSYIDPQSITAARQTGLAVDASKSPAMVTVLRYNRMSHRVSVALSISVQPTAATSAACST